MRLPLLLITASCAAIACALPPSPSARHPTGGRTVRVATWNVHDLFDAEDRLSPPGDLDTVPTPDEVEAKLARVAGVLARIDADVVLLQEVENLPLAEALAARAGYGDARLVDGFDPRGIDVAVLSRLPIGSYVSHLGELGSDGRPLWSRDCVEAHLAFGGEALVIVGNHLVSRITDPVGTRRREQAERMREIADAIARAEPGGLVLAGGDLNDDPAAEPLAPLLADGEWVDALEPLGLASTWTWTGSGSGARFDYLLVPRADAWRVAAASVVDGADVSEASDHRPVVLDLRWGR
jgi:endonuclease/exonuclease/phosphatase family metal-dependent hydrolase